MHERGGRVPRVAMVWTGLMLVVAVVVAVQAMSSLYDGAQACFFNFPAVACPASDDPAVARLTFAFFGLPLVWLGGIGLMVAVWAGQRRRSTTAR